MDSVALLMRLALGLMLLGVTYAVLVVWAVGRTGTKWAWAIWACTLALLTIWGIWSTRLFPGGSVALILYFFVTFLGLPLATATWTIQRGYSRKPDRSAVARVGWGVGAFFAALPFGLLLAAIPDALTLFK